MDKREFIKQVRHWLTTKGVPYKDQPSDAKIELYFNAGLSPLAVVKKVTKGK